MQHPEKNQRLKQPSLSSVKQNSLPIHPLTLTEFEKAHHELFEWFHSKEDIHNIIDNLFFAWQMQNQDYVYTKEYAGDVLHIVQYMQKMIRLLHMEPPLTPQDFQRH